MLEYHYCIELERIIFGELKASPKYSDPDFKNAYFWLEKEVGFYPLFLAVGSSEEDIRMTGYQTQWAKIVASKIVGRKKDGTYIQKNILRKRREFPNYALFSFENVDGIFMDFNYWHIPLNKILNGDYRITNYEKKLVFKSGWSKSRWLRKAKKQPYSVQLVTSGLYLPDAKRIWVRNQKTKKLLELEGFENIEVKRVFL